MSKRIDLTGQKFGRWIVIEFSYYTKNWDYFWKCRCECGNEKNVNRRSLKNGSSKSCGCLHIELARKRGTHRMIKTRFYSVWAGIKNRCNNPNEPTYKDYGKRGIKVCDRWLESFENFRDDMYKEYLEHSKKFGEKDTTIERKENNLGYCKNNCRFATMKEQCNNRRSNHLITYNGKTMNITQWAKTLGIKPYILYYRICRKKWSIFSAFTISPRRSPRR